MPDISVDTSSGSAVRQSDIEYWERLIDEREAAAFLGFTVRCLQGWRHRGGGPRYIKINARNVRYRRGDLRQFVEKRLRTSTSDPGPEGA